LETTFGIIKFSAVTGRAEAAHRSEMVTQLLFGELVKTLDTSNEWVYVEGAADGYKSWILRGSYHPVNQQQADAYTAHTHYLTFDPVSKLKTGPNKAIYIPCSSVLPNFNPDTNEGTLGDLHYIFEGNIVPIKQKPAPEKILVKAAKLLNAPYLWGGKTLMGIDCSGFVQCVFKVAGLQLPRDAYQQAEMGQTIDFANVHPGDLAFFINANGRITHVGILMGNGQIMHASGSVKVSKIDAQGIFNDDLNGYSHNLSLIKRLF
jgi:gamma-D-glutamyl-L-lysine dipeptidyl-peptidase